MKIKEFAEVMESIAPKELAMEWDNVGLLIGSEKEEISSVLVALDCSAATAKEAVELGVDLMLTHHPVFLSGVKSISPDDPETAAPYILMRNGIALFSAHTNLDAAKGGVNDCLAKTLGLTHISFLSPDNMGRLGSIPGSMKLTDFAKLVEERLSTRVRICGDGDAVVSRAALVGGAASSDIYSAHAAGANVFVTGEMKHHHALQAAAMGLSIVEAGHYETERVVLQPLIERLQRLTNDVQYNLTHCEAACLRGI